MRDLSVECYRSLGQKLRDIRKKAGLKQSAVALEMGFRSGPGQVFLSRLERGKAPRVGLNTVALYLRACNAPIGRFMLELAQSGVFGEAEQGLVVVEDREKQQQARRDKAKARYEQRAAREARDAELVAELWRAVQVAIAPMLRQDPTARLVAYLEGVRAFYRAWKLAIRGAGRRDRTSLVQAAFDRVEQAGLEARLIPAAVRRMREVVYDRLMKMTGH